MTAEYTALSFLFLLSRCVLPALCKHIYPKISFGYLGLAFCLKNSHWLNVAVFNDHVVNPASIFYMMQNILAQHLGRKN